MKVGLSLSLCVRDIAEGKVNEADVRFISAGTRIADQEDWDLVMTGYSEDYWSDYPHRARAIANRFRDSGRFLQPRLEGQWPVKRFAFENWIDESEYNDLAKLGVAKC